MKLITGNANVRSAARDYERYSSDLQGDQDVRDYKQLPLEVDPPLHSSIRALIAPVFTKDSLAKLSETAKAKAEPADYTKAATDFATAAAEMAAENLAAFAEIAKKVQMDTVEVMLAAGKNASEETTAAMKKATADVTAQVKKAAAAK